MHRYKKAQSVFLYLVLTLYVILFLSTIVFKNVSLLELFDKNRMIYRSINILPFYRIKDYLTGNANVSNSVVYKNIFGNIALFIPLFIKIVKSMPEALKLLTKIDFLLVVIITDSIEYLSYLKLMRDIKPMPILVLSSRYNVSEKLKAIQLGADEYLAYPCTVEEVVASGKALIRRYTVLNHQAEKPLTVITYHEIFMCVEYRKFFLKGKEIKLTRKEFDLLYLLLSSIGRVYTHEQIYLHVWGGERDIISDNYAVWCLVTRVRKKLRSVSGTFEYIKTVRDVGYCIDMVLE